MTSSRRAVAAACAGALALATAAPLSAASAEVEVSRARYLMGTVCEGTILLPASSAREDRERAAAALESSFDEIARLERILSNWKADSELSRMNRDAHASPVACSADLYDFVLAGVRYARLTDGAFDLTVAPLVRAYDLHGAGRWPAEPELAAARDAVGSGHLRLDDARRTVAFDAAGMSLDPGALGKGYALDAAARVLRGRGVRAALLDFGGQILAIGSPESAPGSPAGWRVAIAHPLWRDEPALTLRLADASLSTSSNAERGLLVDGRPLGHVIDPATGVPVAWRGSASVLASSGTEADALSTALMVMGPDRGLAWAARREGLTAIFLEEDDRGRLGVRSGPGLETHDAARVPRGDEAAGPGGS